MFAPPRRLSPTRTRAATSPSASNTLRGRVNTVNATRHSSPMIIKARPRSVHTPTRPFSALQSSSTPTKTISSSSAVRTTSTGGGGGKAESGAEKAAAAAAVPNTIGVHRARSVPSLSTVSSASFTTNAEGPIDSDTANAVNTTASSPSQRPLGITAPRTPTTTASAVSPTDIPATAPSPSRPRRGSGAGVSASLTANPCSSTVRRTSPSDGSPSALSGTLGVPVKTTSSPGPHRRGSLNGLSRSSLTLTDSSSQVPNSRGKGRRVQPFSSPTPSPHRSLRGGHDSVKSCTIGVNDGSTTSTTSNNGISVSVTASLSPITTEDWGSRDPVELVTPPSSQHTRPAAATDSSDTHAVAVDKPWQQQQPRRTAQKGGRAAAAARSRMTLGVAPLLSPVLTVSEASDAASSEEMLMHLHGRGTGSAGTSSASPNASFMLQGSEFSLDNSLRQVIFQEVFVSDDVCETREIAPSRERVLSCFEWDMLGRHRNPAAYYRNVLDRKRQALQQATKWLPMTTSFGCAGSSYAPAAEELSQLARVVRFTLEEHNWHNALELMKSYEKTCARWQRLHEADVAQLNREIAIANANCGAARLSLSASAGPGGGGGVVPWTGRSGISTNGGTTCDNVSVSEMNDEDMLFAAPTPSSNLLLGSVPPAAAAAQTPAECVRPQRSTTTGGAPMTRAIEASMTVPMRTRAPVEPIQPGRVVHNTPGSPMPQPLQPSQLQQAGVSSSPMKARSSPMGSPLAERERSAEKSDSNFKRWLKKYVLVPKPHSASPLRESSATGNNVHRRLQLEATSSPQQRPSTAMASMTTTTTTLTPTSATMAGQRSPEKSVSNRVIVVPPIAQPIPSPVTGASAHRRTQTANTQYIVSVARIGGSGSTPPGSNPSSVNNRSVITTAVSSPLPAPLSLPVYSGTQSPLPLSPCPPAALSLSQSMSGTVHNTNTPRGRNGNLVVAAAAVAVPGALANAPLRAYELCFPSPPTPTFTLYCFDTLEVGQELKRMVWWCAAHEVCTMHLLVGIHGESPPPLVYSSSPALQRQGTTRGAGGAEESTDETEENEVSEEDVTPGRAQNTTNGSGQGSASRYRRPVPRHRRVSSSGTDSNNADSPTGTAAVYYDTVIMLLRADMWLRRRAVARRGRRAEGWIEVELPLHTIAEAKEKLWLQQLTCTGNTAGNGIRHSFFSLSEEEAASQQREIQEQQNTVR